MKPAQKFLALLCLGQSVCLAIGFWMHSRLEIAATNFSILVEALGLTTLPLESRHRDWTSNVLLFVWIAGTQAAVAALLVARTIQSGQRQQNDPSAAGHAQGAAARNGAAADTTLDDADPDLKIWSKDFEGKSSPLAGAAMCTDVDTDPTLWTSAAEAFSRD